MTARPIRYQRHVSDRNGKIFYTSITSLSHISKAARSIITLREPPFPPQAQRPAPLRSRALILSIKQPPSRMEKLGPSEASR